MGCFKFKRQRLFLNQINAKLYKITKIDCINIKLQLKNKVNFNKYLFQSYYICAIIKF